MSHSSLPERGPHDDLLQSYVQTLRSAGDSIRKIPAIKYLREQTALDLKHAKDAVEDFGARHDIAELRRGEAGCLPLLLLIGAVLATLGVAQCFACGAP